MFKQLTTIFILSYFAFGTFCLPQGNFSAIAELPAMYHHCKATEDKDMTPIDFITDHLINLDCLFDSHGNGDEQKPHTPFILHQTSQNIFFTYFKFHLNFVQRTEINSPIFCFSDKFIPSDYITKIFRPPIV